MASAQSFAELSYNIVREKCAEYSSAEDARSCAKNSDEAIRDLKKNMSELSEKTLLGALALEKNEALACADKQLSFLQSSQQESEEFINDYVYKLTLLGQEKRLINELRKKNSKSKEDLEQYDRALSRAEAILRSLRFAELGPFKDVIQYVAQQYDQYTPDRLDVWLPAQIKSSLKKAITQSVTEVNRDRVIYLKGGLSMGDSLSTAQRESLAQDQQLIESFLTKSKKSGADTTATWCRVNAKYGEGAQYRDNMLMGVSLLSLPASGLLRLGAASAFSAGKGLTGLGNLSVRSAHILKVSAGVAGGVLTASQLYKACLNERTELGAEVTKPENVESCEVNILKSQAQENCSLMAALSALSIPLNIKGTQDAFAALTRNATTRNAAIKKAHEIGRGQVGEDGTAAKVGNYTFAQKRKKARTLQEARILRSERRKLFESGKVGDGDYIDELIRIEDDIVEIEKNAWKMQGSNKGLTDDLIALRAKLDEAMDAPAEEMADRVKKLREELSLVGKTKASTVTADTSNVARIEDILENPQSLRSGKTIPLHLDGKHSVSIRFETDAIDEISKAEKGIVTKFVNSLKTAGSGESIDSTKIKYLTGLDNGTKGRPFEVRIISKGHQRMVGCFNNGVYTVIKYDPQAPQTGAALKHRYGDICK